jgi:hypothetical protein
MSFVWSYEFHHEVAKHLCFLDLLSLSRTSKLHRELFNNEIANGWVRQQMALFFDMEHSHFNALCSMLTAKNGYITESSLLQFLYKEHWNRKPVLQILLPKSQNAEIFGMNLEMKFNEKRQKSNSTYIKTKFDDKNRILHCDKIDIWIDASAKSDSVKDLIEDEYQFNMLMIAFDGRKLWIKDTSVLYSRILLVNERLLTTTTQSFDRYRGCELRAIDFMRRGFSLVGKLPGETRNLDFVLTQIQKVSCDSVRYIIRLSREDGGISIDELRSLFRCRSRDIIEKVIQHLTEEALIFETSPASERYLPTD